MRTVWVFDATTLWLFLTKQFQDIKNNDEHQFCFIFAREEAAYKIKAGARWYYGLLLNVFQLKYKVSFKIFAFEEDNLEGLLRLETQYPEHQIHFVVNDRIKKIEMLKFKNRVAISLIPCRGQFDVNHAIALQNTLESHLGNAPKSKLVISLDLDEMLIFFDESFALGMNYFNPYALDFFKRLIVELSSVFNIEIVVLTARPKDQTHLMPEYLHAENLIAQFLSLTSISRDYLRKDKGGKENYLFYSGNMSGSKSCQLFALYGAEENIVVAHFDDNPVWWKPGGVDSRFMFVQAELVTQIPRVIPQRQVKIRYASFWPDCSEEKASEATPLLPNHETTAQEQTSNRF
ncbi:MAG: hypothetical protein COY58_08395 [Gammaproteobacteria bacterium CG_4_10_14_0_8_um_filter_38_16]|nr:MAG: hypothetical protein COY58_08395 [Gammaproteobacteria bacterium CG_4_10_14_0_8_um_filter_38_16]PJA03120.1 MAG: hypothetical protein COX72_06800 [Gammaproteobacteria bacterium CG_4_10_14_0_2_um_filter_38_22]PJB10377.1 MAG: hypothetical protein CO120_05200 [Gammaproteobacteria bacterium CG_4_9_14_3_um_filter_38_9]